MRRLFTGLAFLTRLPVPGAATFGAEDVGRATLLFPLVGALLGGLLALAAAALYPALPAGVAAGLLLVLSALLTGALHLDALADMADGFGGGRTREDVLRIMRDHVIGAYGGVALVLGLGLKAAALAALLEAGEAARALVLAAALSRWATVPLGHLFPYARREGGLGAAVTDFVGRLELAGASVLAAAGAWALGGVRGLLALALVALLSLLQGLWCRARIGGVTGDTLGANTEVCETAVLVLWLALARAGL